MPAPISLRRRLAPIAATVLALATGVAVGAGPLSDVGTGSGQLAARTDAPALTDASALESLEAADALAAAVAERIHGEALDGSSVAMVVLPGADPATVRSLRAQAAATGAQVTATYRVGEELTAAGGRALVDSLGRRILERRPDLPVPAEAAPYERMGGLLGMVAASTDGTGQQPGPASEDIAEALRTAGLVTGPPAPRVRAPLVLVVLGEDAAEASADPDAVSDADAIVSGLATGLAERAVGTVVVDSTASGAEGALRRLRSAAEDRTWSTLDGVERPLGQVLTAMGLVRAARGEVGDWGVHGEDGAVPRPRP